MEFWFWFQLLTQARPSWTVSYSTTINGNLFGQFIHDEGFSPLRDSTCQPCVRYAVTVLGGWLDSPSCRWWWMSCASGNWSLPGYVQMPGYILSYQPLPARSRWCSGAHPICLCQFFLLTSLHSAVWIYPAMYRKRVLATAGASRTMAARAAISTQGFAQGTLTSNVASKQRRRRRRRQRLPRQTLALRQPWTNCFSRTVLPLSPPLGMRRAQTVLIGRVMDAVARPTTLVNSTSFLAASGTISVIGTWRNWIALMRRREKEWMTICGMTCTICVTPLVVWISSSAVVSLSYTTLRFGISEIRRGTIRVQVSRSVRVIWRGSYQVSFEVSLMFIMSINDDFCMFGQKRSCAILTSIFFFVILRIQIRVYVHTYNVHGRKAH